MNICIVNLEVLKDIKTHDNSNFGNDQTVFYVSSRLIYDLFIPFQPVRISKSQNVTLPNFDHFAAVCTVVRGFKVISCIRR